MRQYIGNYTANHHETEFHDTIDPASVAGILLREFDTPEKAIEYAGEMAKRFLAAHNAIGLDYLEAIKQIKDVMKG